MSKKGWYAVGGVGAAIVVLWVLPWWLAGLIIAALVVAPVVGYVMLDPSQRKRLRRVSRKEVGS